MEKQHRNVLVLSGCQATLQTGGVTLIAITGLTGYALERAFEGQAAVANTTTDIAGNIAEAVVKSITKVP